MTTAHQIVELLTVGQRSKHYAMMQLLKSPEHVDRWHTSEELDSRWLNTGEPLRNFPVAWFEHMVRAYSHRHARFQIEQLEGSDDDEGGVVPPFRIRSVVHGKPQTEAQLLALLRYPSPLASTTDDVDDAFQIALESAFFHDPSAEEVAVLLSATRNGSVLACQLKVPPKGNAEQKRARDNEHEVHSWWKQGPIALKECSVLTHRETLVEYDEELPTEIDEGDKIHLTFARSNKPMYSGKVFRVCIDVSSRGKSACPISLRMGSSSSSSVETSMHEVRFEFKETDRPKTVRAEFLARNRRPKDDVVVWRVRVEWDEIITQNGKTEQTKKSESLEWVTQLRPTPEVFRGSWALFRKELVCPFPLPRSVPMLPAFREPLAPGPTSSANEGVSRSWWANASSVAMMVASEKVPNAQHIADIRSDVITNVKESQRSGKDHHLPGAATKQRKRQKRKEISNTHLVHYGLNLRQPFQRKSRFQSQRY